MARTLRLASAENTYHVVNRGNDRRVIFPERADYARFRSLLIERMQRYGLQIFGACLMPNHFTGLGRAIGRNGWPGGRGEVSSAPG
jgi:putative transposase